MKRIYIILLMMTSALLMNAQIDPEASALLKKVSAKYKAYTSSKTDYSIKIHFAEAKTDIVKKGTLYLKGAKFKMQIDEVISTCDGKNIWNYLPNEKQVQISVYDKADGNISPEKFFTLWEKDYIYRIKEKKTVNGKNTAVIEMSPTTKKNGGIFKIDVTINTSTNELMSFLIYEKNGTRTTYTINTTTPNISLAETFFTFDAKQFPGVEVVDLR
jgi:outer membrane lipoprotein carrier protein